MNIDTNKKIALATVKDKHIMNVGPQKILMGALLLGGLTIAGPGWSACTFVSGYSSDTVIDVSYGTVTVPSSAPVGSVVGTVKNTVLSSRPTFITNCDTGNANEVDNDYRDAGLLPVVSYGGQTLYPSGVAGFAIRIVTPGEGYTSGLFGTGTFPRILNRRYCAPTGSYCGSSWGPVTFELVKINATTGAGNMSAGTLIRTSIRGWNYVATFRLIGSSIVSPSCVVNNTSINVPLGNIGSHNFTGVGSAAAAQPVPISLNCYVNTNISVQLDGVADSSGRTGTIALSQTSKTATGVAVEVRYNGNPVPLGKPLLVGTTTTAGTFTPNLTARYVQTLGTVNGGLANSTATFTMTYN